MKIKVKERGFVDNQSVDQRGKRLKKMFTLIKILLVYTKISCRTFGTLRTLFVKPWSLSQNSQLFLNEMVFLAIPT